MDLWQGGASQGWCRARRGLQCVGRLPSSTPFELTHGVPVIRTIKSLDTDCPDFLGNVSLGSYGFTHVRSLELRNKLARANLALPISEKIWSLGYYMNPSAGGKGIMTVCR